MVDGFIEFIERHVPPGFFVRLAEEYEQDYSRAVESCEERFAAPEAHDLTAYERRARTENSLLHVGAEFAHRGLRVAAATNSTASNFHRELRAGDGQVVLTAASAQYPGELIRFAGYRDTLARSRQTSFLDADAGQSTASSIYGIVLHGCRRIADNRTFGVLGFYQLAIPNANCSAYLKIYNLAERYAYTEVDPEDVRAAMDQGVPIEPVRRPSALLRTFRRRAEQ